MRHEHGDLHLDHHADVIGGNRTHRFTALALDRNSWYQLGLVACRNTNLRNCDTPALGRFVNANALNTTWTAPASQLATSTYEVFLKVSDGSLSAKDSVEFTVRKWPTPSKPVIHTGAPGSQRGWIVLDWDSTDNTDSYRVLQLKNGTYTELSSPGEVSIDFEETTAVVMGLDPYVEHIYSFQVRAVNDHGSLDSEPFTVNIRPAPDGHQKSTLRVHIRRRCVPGQRPSSLHMDN